MIYWKENYNQKNIDIEKHKKFIKKYEKRKN